MITNPGSADPALDKITSSLAILLRARRTAADNAVRFCALSSLCKPGLSRGWVGDQSQPGFDIVHGWRKVGHELGEERVVPRVAAQYRPAVRTPGRPFDAKQWRAFRHPKQHGVLLGRPDRGDRLRGTAEHDAELLGQRTLLERPRGQACRQIGSDPDGGRSEWLPVDAINASDFQDGLRRQYAAERRRRGHEREVNEFAVRFVAGGPDLALDRRQVPQRLT